MKIMLGLMLCLAASTGPVFSAWANPGGGSVRAGQATFATRGSTFDINQTSSTLVIDWAQFDIAPGETTRFNQPSQNAIAVNRILDSGQKTTIEGRLSANGRLVIINPNGALITQSGQVDAHSFVTTTANSTTENFVSGVFDFNQPGLPDAMIENQGTVTVRDGGLALFVAPVVRNSGVIQGHAATVHLAAGDIFAVDLFGDGLISLEVSGPRRFRSLKARNTGELRTDGGAVMMSAADASALVDTVIHVGGVLAARGLDNVNGEIVLTSGGNIDLDTAILETDGGNVTVEAKNGTVAINDTIIETRGGEGTGLINLIGKSVAAFLSDPENDLFSGTPGGRIQVTSHDLTGTANCLNAGGGAPCLRPDDPPGDVPDDDPPAPPTDDPPGNTPPGEDDSPPEDNTPPPVPVPPGAGAGPLPPSFDQSDILLASDPLARPIISVADQAAVTNEAFEPVETKDVDTDVSLLTPNRQDERDFTLDEILALEPAAGGDANDSIGCANAFLDNQAC